MSVDRNEIQGKVIGIIVEQLGIEQADVKEESNFIDDLGADSLDTVELVMAFEEEFGNRAFGRTARLSTAGTSTGRRL